MGKLAVNCLKGFVYVSALVIGFVGGAKFMDNYVLSDCHNETTDEANA